MGTDNPQSSMQGLPDFIMPQTRTSGGDQSFLSEPHIPVPPPSGLGDALISAGRAIGNAGNELSAAVAARRREEDRKAKEIADKQRALQLAQLQSHMVVQESRAFDDFDKTYTGAPDQYESTFTQGFEQREQERLKGITDPELSRQYQIQSAEFRAKLQLKALDVADVRRTQAVKTDFNNALKGLEDQVNANPTVDTLNQVLQNADDLKGHLFAGKLGTADQADMAKFTDTFKEHLTEYLINQQADHGAGTRLESIQAAMDTLADPNVNQNLSIENRQSLENKLTSAYNSELSSQRQLAKSQLDLLLPSYLSAAIEGKDTSAVEGQINALGQMPGVLSPEDVLKLQVTQQIVPQYKEFIQNMPSMDDATRAEYLRRMDPDNQTGPIGADYAIRKEIYNKFLDVVKTKQVEYAKDPIAAEGAASGLTDPESIMRRIVGNAVSRRENLNDVRLLGEAQVNTALSGFHNALATGNFDAVVSQYNNLVNQFSPDKDHPYRQVAPNVTWTSIVLNQLHAASKEPLTSRFIAALMLTGQAGPVTQSNSYLLRSAMLPDEARATKLASLGIKNDELLTMVRQNPVANRYFSPQNPSTQMDSILADQVQLLANAAILRATSPGAQKGGVQVGPFHFGQSDTQASVNAVIGDFLPFKAADFSGFTHKAYPAGSTNAMLQRLGVGPALFADDAIKDQKNYLEIQKAEILIPNQYANAGVDAPKIRQFLADKLTNPQWVHENVVRRHNGQAVTGAASLVSSGNIANDIYHTLIAKVEGGYVANDAGFGPTNHGINFTHNQGILKEYGITSPDQMKSLTKAQAQEIAYRRYYVPSGAANVRDPRIAALLYDTYFNYPAGSAKMVAAVPELERVKNLPPTASNIPVLDAVYNKLKAARIQAWQGASNWGTYGNSWLNRQKNVDVLSQRLRNQVSGPLTPADMPKGHQVLQDEAMKSVRRGIWLTNSEDRTRIRVNTMNVSGRVVPFMTSDGTPLEFSFDEIQKAKKPTTMGGHGGGGGSGQIESGNIDLYHRPVVHNADGSISTVRSITVEMDGKHIVLPTVSEDGHIMSDNQAVNVYKKTGRHLGIFKTEAAANRYAQQLHEQQAQFYKNKH